MIFRTAAKEDTEELIALWKLCFPEDAEEDAFLRDFFRTFFTDAEAPANIVTAAAEDSRQITAMAVLIPVALRIGEETHPIYYLYAMCTHPDHRMRGIGLKLLTFAEETAKTNGKQGIALLPAGKDLCRFYQKAGYEIAFTDDPSLPDGIVYPESYLAFEDRYEWDGAPEDVSGMFRSLGCKIKGLANMAYPLS